MVCPRCSTESPDHATECPSCGIVFSKWKARESGARTVTPSPPGPPAEDPFRVPWKTLPAASGPPPPPETLGITHPGWRAAAIGLVMAWILTFFPLIKFILSPLTTLIHEIGHTSMLWLFGYPAVPAFDFGNGGGVTMSEQTRSAVIVAAWASGALGLGWHFRESKRVLAGLGVAALIYLAMFNRIGEVLAITLGGHGGEIAFATLFLYRGLTGWGCKVETERPLYAFIAFMILFSSIQLGWSLRGPTLERNWYLEGKGGLDNDLVTGAQILRTTLGGIAGGLIAISLLTIPAAFFAAAHRKRIGVVSEAEEEV